MQPNAHMATLIQPWSNAGRRPHLSDTDPIRTPAAPLESQNASSEHATNVTEPFKSLAVTGMLETYASMLEMTKIPRLTTRSHEYYGRLVSFTRIGDFCTSKTNAKTVNDTMARMNNTGPSLTNRQVSPTILMHGRKQLHQRSQDHLFHPAFPLLQ